MAREEAAAAAQKLAESGVPVVNQKANLKALKDLVPVHAFTAEHDDGIEEGSDEDDGGVIENFDDEIVTDDEDEDEDGEGEEGDDGEEGEEEDEDGEEEEEEESDEEEDDVELVVAPPNRGTSPATADDRVPRSRSNRSERAPTKGGASKPSGGISWEDVFDE